MFQKSTTEWKKSLTNILEELCEQQYKKMLEFLEKIPKSRKNTRSREQMAQTIIEFYGEDKSISEINKVMDDIPRRDPSSGPAASVCEKETSGKKKRKTGTFLATEKKKRISSGFKKNRVVRDSDSSEDEAQDDDPESPQSEKKIEVPPWRTSIELLKDSGTIPTGKPVGGKVVQKSGLRTYETKKKEKKFFFYLGVADETDCIKVMVYEKERYQKFVEGQLYNFRDIIVEKFKGEKVMKVLSNSKFSKTNKIEVGKTLELQAQMLVYNQYPVCSIEKILSFDEKTGVSVEGTVAEINSLDQVKLKKKRTKENIRKFKLEDETGSIWITLWRRDIEQLKGKSVGDCVRVTNLKTSRYYETTSLNSTDFTRIYKVQSAAVQNVTMQIIGIIKSGRMECELDVSINNHVNTFIIASPLLAKVLGIRLEGDFEERLLEKIPFSTEAEIKGNQILDLKDAKEM